MLSGFSGKWRFESHFFRQLCLKANKKITVKSKEQYCKQVLQFALFTFGPDTSWLSAKKCDFFMGLPGAYALRLAAGFALASNPSLLVAP